MSVARECQSSGSVRSRHEAGGTHEIGGDFPLACNGFIGSLLTDQNGLLAVHARPALAALVLGRDALGEYVKRLVEVLRDALDERVTVDACDGDNVELGRGEGKAIPRVQVSKGMRIQD